MSCPCLLYVVGNASFLVRIRLPIKSTADLAAIFNRQLRNASVLALEPGVVHGYVDVLVLSNIVCSEWP